MADVRRFYWDNIAVYLGLFWYQLLTWPFLLAGSAFALMAVVSSLACYIMGKPLDHLIGGILLTSVALLLLGGLVVVGKILYVTIYTIGLGSEQSAETEKLIWQKIYAQPFWRLFRRLVIGILIAFGAVFMFGRHLDRYGAMRFDLFYLTAMSALILEVLILIAFLKHKRIVEFLKDLWHLFTGVLWKVAAVGGICAVLAAVFAILFLFMSFVFASLGFSM